MTTDPVVAPGGSNIEGNSIKWARSPSKIYIKFNILSRVVARGDLTAIPASESAEHVSDLGIIKESRRT